jgi:hypothetical protein
MKHRDIERVLDDWARHETLSAPELYPTPDMYHMVQATGAAPKPSHLFKRWLVVSAAAAALLVMAVIYPVLFGPAPGRPPRSALELEMVGLRKAPVAEKAAPQMDAIPPKRGKKGPGQLLGRLEFEFKPEASLSPVRVDMMGPREEAISLTSADTYRLVVEPVSDLYVYVFQLPPAGMLIKLFPNPTYGPSSNPLGPNQAHLLPPEPNWFYLGTRRGEEHLYVLASLDALHGLEALYDEYTGETMPAARAAHRSDLLGLIDSIVAGRQDRASGWMVPFQHR